jgi:hypothetical protein
MRRWVMWWVFAGKQRRERELMAIRSDPGFQSTVRYGVTSDKRPRHGLELFDGKETTAESNLRSRGELVEPSCDVVFAIPMIVDGVWDDEGWQFELAERVWDVEVWLEGFERDAVGRRIRS